MKLDYHRLWRRFWPQLIIIGIWLAIVATNYRPGTWLTGWDNLHPEMDPTHDLWRTFNAVWQEYQGLGLLGGMAHSADLVRQLLILSLRYILPVSIIRYSMLFGQLLLGGLGAYTLFQTLFNSARPKSLTSRVTATAAASFYLLNLGTVQNFYVAFEPFYWFFGTLPWLLHFLLRAWRYHKIEDWIYFTLVSFLATPMAYIQTNFVVYGVVLTVFGLCYLFGQRPKFSWRLKIKRLSVTVAIVAITNAFWLLPMAYFFLTGGSQVTVESQINQVATKEVTVQNQTYANLRSILQLQGYWFAGQDYNSSDDNEQPIPTMTAWADAPVTEVLSYLFAGLLIAGIVYLLLYKRQQRSLSVILGFTAMIGLLLLNQFHLGVINQILRSPFTKVVVPLSLFYSLLVGASLFWLDWLWNRRLIAKTYLPIFGGCYLLLLLLYSVPTFTGHFIYPNLRQVIPREYFQFFQFMRTQPDAARTALLPAESMYGWQHTDWGQRGIGFYWFGIHQSILNRAFDVWSLDNEEFYHELAYTRIQRDASLFQQILRKYDVRYLIMDTSIHRRNRDKSFFNQSWYNLIGAIGCQQVFRQNFLQVFDCGSQSDNYLSTPSQYYINNTQQSHHFYDPMRWRGLDYVTSNDLPATDYPFAYLYQRELNNDQVAYQEINSQTMRIVATADLPTNTYRQLYVPGLNLTSSQPFLFTVRNVAGRYQFSLSPIFDISINDQALHIFQPLSFVGSALASGQEVYFDFGSDYVRLRPQVNQTVSSIVFLSNFDQEQTWHYFPANLARNQGLNINVNYQNVETIDAPTSIWSAWRQSQTFDIDVPVTKLEALVTTTPIPLESMVTDNYENCDARGRGLAYRTPHLDNQYTYYANDDGSFCDTFYSVKLNSGKSSFFIRVDADNQEGLPMIYYFWDINNQTQSWETLLSADQITNTFSFPQSLHGTTTAYFDLHNTNRSIAGETAINNLLQTTAYPVPSQWLSGIQLRQQAGEPAIQLNSIVINQTKKTGTSHYQAQIQFQARRPGLLVLTQAYHPGWRAKIGSTTLPHEEYDGWANAWLIDPSLCPTGRCTVKISFWPQWLGWLGLGISLTSFLGVSGWWAYRLYQRRHRPRQRKKVKNILRGQKKASSSVLFHTRGRLSPLSR